MSRKIFGAVLLVCAIAFAPTPAWAVRLVQNPDDQWRWIDLDSINTRAGFTYYSTAFSRSAGVSPATEGYVMGPLAETSRINCSTGEQFWYDGMYDQWDSIGAASVALRSLICRG